MLTVRDNIHEPSLDVGDLLMLDRRIAGGSGIVVGPLTSVAANSSVTLGQKGIQSVEIAAATGAAAVVTFPPNPGDGDGLWIKSINQVPGATSASLVGNGNNVEDPGNLGATAATVNFPSGQGQMDLFVFRKSAGVWRIYA